MSADKKINEIKQFCETSKNWCLIASLIGVVMTFTSTTSTIGTISATLTSVSLGFFLAIAIVRSMIGWPNIEEKE